MIYRIVSHHFLLMLDGEAMGEKPPEEEKPAEVYPIMGLAQKRTAFCQKNGQNFWEVLRDFGWQLLHLFGKNMVEYDMTGRIQI